MHDATSGLCLLNSSCLLHSTAKSRHVHPGFEVLTAMEKVLVGDEDRPEQPITITGATVFVNPYKDEEEEERKAAEKVRSVCWQNALG